jgi:hypothetical protein
VKLSSEFKKIVEPNNEVSDERKTKSIREPKETLVKRNGTENGEAPRHDLKIIIAKKPSSKSKFFESGNNKVRLNKPNSGSNSKVLNDFERLRGNVDNFTSASSSEIASASEMKTTLSKKTGTVSHHDLKLENKSNTKRHNNDSHDFYEFTMNEGEKEKCDLEKQQQKRESTKHTNSSSSSSLLLSSSSSSSSGRHSEKFKVKSNLSLNIPKLKIELPSLKTKITVPKTPNESYSISKSPFSKSKCEPHIKKVRFDMSNTSHAKSNDRSLYDFEDETESNCFDQKKYAERIGLKPVERKVESIILHRKRKKSKHSKEIEHSKRPKLHVSSSLDESLKLKLKIMGGKNCKNDKKFNEEEASERTCNLKAVHCKTADLSSINVHEVKHKKHEQEKQKEAVVELENHKYSVTEQKITKTDSNQPMVFIPKLVLQKTTMTMTTAPTSTTYTASKTEGSNVNNNNNNASNSKNNSTTNYHKKEETAQVQRRNSILLDQHKQQQQQQQSLSFDANKSHEIKLKIKPLDKIADERSNNQKAMKPPHAKMGSPSSTLSSSPIRPNSIPASLKLSPISSPSLTAAKNDAQNLKRSLSLGAEKSPHCYFNPYAKSNTEMFTREPPLVKIPPLVATSPTFRNVFSNTSYSDTQQNAKAPVTISKVPNINVKDPMKLFPNACPSVEILKIPQTAPIANHQPLVKNVKLNRQVPPTTIPLEKIKQSAQSSAVQKYLPKTQSNHLNQNNLIKTPSYHQQKINIPQTSSSSSTNSSNRNSSNTSSNINQLTSFNVGASHNPNFSQDLTLERYHYELSKDIAKLDQSLSLEKNFEHWGKQKLQEFSKVTDVKSFTKNLLNTQQMSMSVRNIPNPSALMMFRNQNSNLNQKQNAPSSPTAVSSSPKQTVTSTSTEHSDIEELLSKSTIAKGTEKPFFENVSLNVKPAANHSAKINEKKSIAKLTEFLRLTATAAQSKETRQDEDNNNNNNNNNNTSLKNDKNFNLIDGSRANASIVGQKSSPLDVICIDS